MRAALGVSIHTGWAACVVVADPLQLLDRRKISLAGDDVRFAYHMAAAEPAGAARRIAAVARSARQNGEEALRALLDEQKVTLAALPRPKRELPPLEAILAAHPLLHAAEGELYRHALEDACRAVGLKVVFPDPVEPDLGKPGPPWAKDQRDAAALAWGALDALGARKR